MASARKDGLYNLFGKAGDQAAKGAAGAIAQGVGQVVGVPEEVGHLVWDTAKAAQFIKDLADPLNPLFSPPGESAVDRLAAGSKAAAGSLAHGVTHLGEVW